MNESSFSGAGGLHISTHSWHPAAGTPRAIVIIVPGFKSHSGYYEWVADQLLTGGLAAYAIDLRGRGKSEGERFYVQSFEDYVTDVASFVSIIKEKEKDLPVFLLGHSAKGFNLLFHCQFQASEVRRQNVPSAVTKLVMQISQPNPTPS